MKSTITALALLICAHSAHADQFIKASAFLEDEGRSTPVPSANLYLGVSATRSIKIEVAGHSYSFFLSSTAKEEKGKIVYKSEGVISNGKTKNSLFSQEGTIPPYLPLAFDFEIEGKPYKVIVTYAFAETPKNG